MLATIANTQSEIEEPNNGIANAKTLIKDACLDSEDSAEPSERTANATKKLSLSPKSRRQSWSAVVNYLDQLQLSQCVIKDIKKW